MFGLLGSIPVGSFTSDLPKIGSLDLPWFRSVMKLTEVDITDGILPAADYTSILIPS